VTQAQSAALGLLHGFELRCGDARITLTHSAQRLMALLALRGRPVRRDWAAGTLWLDSSQEQANGCLRTTLWRADPAARELVRATATELSLADGVAVDAVEMTASARRVFARDAGHDDLLALQQAGELLPDWYDDWVVLERERLRQLRLHALEMLCADLTAQGRYAEAVEAGLAAMIGEPLRESAQRALIGAYLAEGNPSDALRQYRIFRERLWRDLALTPSPALQGLVSGILPPVTVA
jgi:DNA-binding SARP family transcriptional activator